MDKFGKEGSKIAELIEKGREQGYLTYADVNDHLPEDISEPEQFEENARTICFELPAGRLGMADPGGLRG